MFATLAIYLFGLLILLGNVGESQSSIRQEPAPRIAWQMVAATTNPTQAKNEMKTAPVAGVSSGAPSIDACALLEKSEIALVQGLPVQQIQPTSQKHGDLNFSQCYYTANSADGSKNLSVYIQLIQRDPKSARRDAVKEFWEERFGRERKERDSEEKSNEETEGEEAINSPLHVSGVGDEAFWLGSSRGGALFVLKKGKVLRVTVGGEDTKTQMEKSKTLATKALARLN